VELKYKEIPIKFTEDLQLILNTIAPELNEEQVKIIKFDAKEALHKILIKYKLIDSDNF